MKKLTLAVGVFFLFTQYLNAQNEKNFALTGTVSGMDTGQLYLKYYDQGNKVLDSAKVIKGQFEFTGFISEPVMAELADGSTKNMRTGYQNYFPDFYLEPGKMMLTLTNSKFAEGTLTGSKINEDFQALEKISTPLSITFYALEEKVRKDTLNDKELADSFELHKKKTKEALLQFIAERPGSVVTAKAIGWLAAYGANKEKRVALLDSLPPAIKNGYSVSRIKKFIAIEVSSAVGDTAPLFSSADINGKQVRLTDFKAKYVLLEFWASWCAPCRALTPEVKKLYSKYFSSGFDIITISTDTDTAAWKKAIAHDQTGDWHPIVNPSWEINHLYSVAPIPHLVLIDKDGKIIGHYMGMDEVTQRLTNDLATIFEK